MFSPSCSAFYVSVQELCKGSTLEAIPVSLGSRFLPGFYVLHVRLSCIPSSVVSRRVLCVHGFVFSFLLSENRNKRLVVWRQYVIACWEERNRTLYGGVGGWGRYGRGEGLWEGGDG